MDDLQPMDDFELELQAAMRRRPAPPGLKGKVINQLWENEHRASHRMVWFERIAATFVLAGVVSGAVLWRNAEEQQRGAEARQQVFTALRITNRALEQMNAQLQAHGRSTQ
jgi:hypothetical protein